MLGACIGKIPAFYPTRLRMYTSSCLNTLYNQGVICQISHISMLTIRFENKQMYIDIGRCGVSANETTLHTHNNLKSKPL